MDFDKIFKRSLRYFKREEKWLLIEYNLAEELKDVLKKAMSSKERLKEVDKNILKKMQDIVSKIGTAEFRRAAWHNHFIKSFSLIAPSVKSVYLEELRQHLQDYDVDNSQLIKFLGRGGVLADVFDLKPVEKFDGSVQQALNVVENHVLKNRIASMESVIKSIKGMLSIKDLKLKLVSVDLGRTLTKIPAGMKSKTEVIIDSNYAADMEEFKEATGSDYYFLDKSQFELVLLDSVIGELSHRPRWATRSLVKRDLMSYLYSIAKRVKIVPTAEEIDYITKIWSLSSRKASAGDIAKFQSKADLQILVYAFRRGKLKLPTVILTDDRDIKDTVVFLVNNHGMNITTYSFLESVKTAA